MKICMTLFTDDIMVLHLLKICMTLFTDDMHGAASTEDIHSAIY